MAIDFHALWQQMNERQRHFMTTLYEVERNRAAYYNSQKAMFDPLKKGAEWRWMVHNPPGGGGLQDTLDDAVRYDPVTGKKQDPKTIKPLLNNQGSGSTYKMLEEQGYLERRWEDVEVMSLMAGRTAWVSVLSVRLTPRGRKLAKLMLEDPAEKPGPEEVRDELKKKARRLLEKLHHHGGTDTWYVYPSDWQDASESSARTVCAGCGKEARVEALARVRDRITGSALDGTCPAFQEMLRRKFEERVGRPCFLLRIGWLDLRALSAAVRDKCKGRPPADIQRETELSLSEIYRVSQGWSPNFGGDYPLICAWLGVPENTFLVPAPADAGTIADNRRGYYG